MAVIYSGSGPGGAIQAGVDQWTPVQGEEVRQDLNSLDDRIETIEGMVGSPGSPESVGSPSLELGDLSDVSIVSPAVDQVLQFDGTIWRNQAGGRRAIVNVTDAQVKALVTTPIVLISAPGSNKFINIQYAILLVKFSAGAYTNVNTTFSAIAVAVDSAGSAAGAAPTQGVINDNSTDPALTALTTFMGAANRHVKLLPYHEIVPVLPSPAAAGYLIPTVDGSYNMDLFADLNNKGVFISADNNGSGNFTGGNAANSLRVIVSYTIEDIP